MMEKSEPCQKITDFRYCEIAELDLIAYRNGQTADLPGLKVLKSKTRRIIIVFAI